MRFQRAWGSQDYFPNCSFSGTFGSVARRRRRSLHLMLSSEGHALPCRLPDILRVEFANLVGSLTDMFLSLWKMIGLFPFLKYIILMLCSFNLFSKAHPRLNRHLPPPPSDEPWDLHALPSESNNLFRSSLALILQASDCDCSPCKSMSCEKTAAAMSQASMYVRVQQPQGGVQSIRASLNRCVISACCSY